MLSWWTPAPKSDRLPTLEPTAIWPKLSVRVPDELHQRVRIAAIRQHTSVQALVTAALVAYLGSPPG